MRTCEEYEHLVSAFIDGALPEEDRGRLMEHMASCPACQDYFNDQIAIHDALMDRAELRPPAELTAAVMAEIRPAPAKKKRLWQRWQSWGALAACCALVVLGGWRLNLWRWERTAEEYQADTCIVTEAGAPKLYAARSVPGDGVPIPAPAAAPEAEEAAPALDDSAADGGVEAYALPAPVLGSMENSGAEGAQSFFDRLPECFLFASGAGAWRTELHIASDGSFTGNYTDSNAGWEGHPAEQYYCNFSGQFSEPVQVDEFTWSVQVESLELENTPGETDYIKADNLNRIASTPYGMENAKEVLIYLPGAAVEDLPEMFRNWTHAPETGALGFYGLYNVEEELGFSGYDQ